MPLENVKTKRRFEADLLVQITFYEVALMEAMFSSAPTSGVTKLSCSVFALNVTKYAVTFAWTGATNYNGGLGNYHLA